MASTGKPSTGVIMMIVDSGHGTQFRPVSVILRLWASSEGVTSRLWMNRTEMGLLKGRSVFAEAGLTG
jgi:hypothetical protein